MNNSRKAFTLIELLVVIAIIAILAAILFPVFAQAKAAAKKAVSISNNKQLTLASIMYAGDNDDHFMTASYNNTYDDPFNPNTMDGLNLDEAWPYFKNEGIMFDPLDSASLGSRLYPGPGQGLTDPNTVPPAYYQDVRLFNLATTADYGISFQYINPEYVDATGTHPTAVSTTQIARSANTIFATSSIWNRDAAGNPFGGGNAGVDPPCVIDSNGNDTRPGYQQGDGYYWYTGWNPTEPKTVYVFGETWPWYNSGQTEIVSYSDGHAKAVALTQLTLGCNVQDGWAGEITNVNIYPWISTQ